MVTTAPTVHIRVNGRSLDVPMADLDLGYLSRDREITEAAARYLDIPARTFRDHVVDRHETGNLTIRPQAVFG